VPITTREKGGGVVTMLLGKGGNERKQEFKKAIMQ
jgi:hypothetical protein